MRVLRLVFAAARLRRNSGGDSKRRRISKMPDDLAYKLRLGLTRLQRGAKQRNHSERRRLEAAHTLAQDRVETSSGR